jgi:hypothetical protein
MGMMIFILFKLLVKPKPEAMDSVTPNQKPLIEKKKIPIETVVEKHYCLNHKESPSVGSCLICEEVFCNDCLIEHESMHFCKEHFKTFASHKWKQITDELTTPDTPETGAYIYRFKHDQWVNKKIPSFVMTHYKINLENDYIESFIQLNVREDDVEKLSLELKTLKNNS